MYPLLSWPRFPAAAAGVALLVSTLIGCFGGIGNNNNPLCDTGDLSPYLFHDGSVTLANDTFEGTAQVTSHTVGSLTLLLDSGESVDFTYSLAGDTLPAEVGETLQVSLNLYQPWWTETILVLREMDGSLRFAIWDTSGALPSSTSMDGLSVVYVDPGCRSTDDGGCGPRIPLALELTTAFDLPPTAAASGTAETTGDYRIVNGVSSGQFTGDVMCTDTPSAWTSGYVLRLDSASPVDAADVIADYVTDSGLVFNDCGAVSTDQCGWVPTAADQAVYDCLVAGFAACEPTRAEETRPTVEGAPLVQTYFVIPDGSGGCSVEYFVDFADDPWAPESDLFLQACTSLVQEPICSFIEVDDCTLVEEWDLVN